MDSILKLVDLGTGQYSGSMLELRLVCYYPSTDGRAAPMGVKRTVTYNGRQVEGEVVAFEQPIENWTQYILEDGTILKMRLVLLEVVRLLGEYNQTTGDPVYVFQAQQMIGANSPDKLKKKVN